ncbi:DUF2946 family protein [Desertibaculum subflavum]|uniref:DUF2946 family protein n=1 Tax=Desertibaculum subflavum TaxID=2268458 RepID=UPI0013C49BF9
MRRMGSIRPGKGGATLLALLALFLQAIMPLAHAAAMAAQAVPGILVICTAEGPKQVRIADDGSFEPVDQTGKLPPACPGCPIGAPASALPPPAQPEIGVALTTIELPPRIEPAASPASPRYPPSHPRAPPASV